MKPKSEWIKIPIEPIVDEKLFWRVQEILDERAKRNLRTTKYQYLLQGLIRCARCHRIYNGKRKGLCLRLRRPNGDHFSYVCPQKFGRHLGEPHCHAKEISVRRLDRGVWAYIVSLIENPDRVKKALHTIAGERENSREFNQAIYDKLMDKKADLEAREQRFLDLYGDAKMKKESLDKKMAETHALMDDLNKQIIKAQQELQRIENLSLLEKEIDRLISVFRGKIEDTTFEFQKFVIRSWVKEINVLDNGDVLIKTRLPDLDVYLKERLGLIPMAIPEYQEEFVVGRV